MPKYLTREQREARRAAIAEHVRSGMSINEAMETFGVVRSAVHAACKAHGVPTRTPPLADDPEVIKARALAIRAEAEGNRKMRTKARK